MESGGSEMSNGPSAGRRLPIYSGFPAAFPVPDRPASTDISLSVVSDSLQACPYLDNEVARMPLLLPDRELEPPHLDRLLDRGYRRCGRYFYRTMCPSCQECVPVRVDVSRFRERPSMKRILNRAERELSIEYGKVTGGEERLALFNRHRSERELGDHAASEEDLRSFLLESSVETIELRIQNAGRLVCIAIADLGRESINAVYTYFDSREKRFSLGTLAVLELIRFARQTQRRFVYLGLFVADCRHLNYKARFWPQERRLNGEWLRFDTAD